MQTSGNWKQGIGQFINRYSATSSSDTDFDDFYHLLTDVSGHMKFEYPGSTTLVTRLLGECCPDGYTAFLCDTNTDICKALIHFNRNNPHVQVFNENGYARARTVMPLDLIFIDPPDVDEQLDDYLGLIEYCVSREQAFISWNSLHGNPDHSGPSHSSTLITSFALRNQIPLFEASWQDWTPRMCGCQMLLHVPNGDSLKQSARQLARLMNWPSR